MFYPKNLKKFDRAVFERPTAEYRGAPFWAWNCKLQKDEMLRQIEYFEKMGMGGFHMHVRTGMETPYLSDEYMDFVQLCVDEARRKNMLAYLYDEDRWPSGSCGGRVTAEHPEFSKKYLLFTAVPYGGAVKDASKRNENGSLLAVYDVSLGGDGSLSKYRRITETEVPGAEGRVWYAYIEQTAGNPWYNGYSYIDTMDKRAVEEFVKTTYDRYYECFGDDFGKVIPSIFTDEPQFMLEDCFSFAESDADVRIPWTVGMDEKFETAKGYRILDCLPEVFWELPNGDVSKARYDYHDFLAELFASSYCDTLGDWCVKHNIALGGHLMFEDTLMTQTRAIGEAMRAYRAFKAMPGMDLLCDRREFNTAIQCRSVKRQQGSEAMLSELYGVTGWDFDFRGHKLQGDWQAALGVTLRVPHLTWMSMKGEAKRDYPASIGYQSPWWKKYSLIEDHFARLNTALTRGDDVIKIGVIHPIESYWLRFGPASQTSAVRDAMDNQHRALTEYLLTGMMNFDFISEAMLPDFCEQGGYPLKVGRAEYNVIIVPGCATLRRTTLDRLEEFKKQGGKLIFIGEAPLYENALPSDRPKRLYDDSVVVPCMRAAVLDAVEDQRFVDVRLEQKVLGASIEPCQIGSRPEHLIHQLRRDGDGYWFFMCRAFNPVCIDTEPDLTLSIKFKGEYALELFDTLTGKTRVLPAEYTDGCTVLHKKWFMHDSMLLRLTPGRHEGCGEFPQPASDGHCADSKVGVSLSEPNALLIDIAEFCTEGEDFQGPEEFLRIDNICREKIGIPKRAKHIVQPYCASPEPPKHKIKLRTVIPSEIEYKGALLALEDSATTSITFNGERVKNKPNGWYVDRSIETIPLPDIKIGDNVLELEVLIGERIGLEWCYLLGDFGVRVDGVIKTVTAPVRELAFGDFTHQGLPFYTGNVDYSFTAQADRDGNLSVRVLQYRGALIEVLIDGKPAGDIAFSPYVFKAEGLAPGGHEITLRLYGTRQNGFAQLHHTTGFTYYQDPDSWRTVGALWVYEYQFKPAGILSAPIIK